MKFKNFHLLHRETEKHEKPKSPTDPPTALICVIYTHIYLLFLKPFWTNNSWNYKLKLMELTELRCLLDLMKLYSFVVIFLSLPGLVPVHWRVEAAIGLACAWFAWAERWLEEKSTISGPNSWDQRMERPNGLSQRPNGRFFLWNGRFTWRNGHIMWASPSSALEPSKLSFVRSIRSRIAFPRHLSLQCAAVFDPRAYISITLTHRRELSP